MKATLLLLKTQDKEQALIEADKELERVRRHLIELQSAVSQHQKSAATDRQTIADLQVRAAAADALAAVIEQKKGFTEKLIERCNSAKAAAKAEQQIKCSLEIALAAAQQELANCKQNADTRVDMHRELEVLREVNLPFVVHSTKQSLHVRTSCVACRHSCELLSEATSRLLHTEQEKAQWAESLSLAEQQRNAAFHKLTQRDASMMALSAQYRSASKAETQCGSSMTAISPKLKVSQ